jgi:type II secretory pathway component PulC
MNWPALSTVVLLVGMPLPAQETQRPPQLPSSSLPLRLTGVMVDDKAAANSSCLVRCTRSEERHGALRVGDVACEVAEIKEIREDGLVIRNLDGSRLEFLAFPPDAGKAGSRADAPAPASARGEEDEAPAPVAIDLPKASVTHYLSNLGELLQSALAVPHYTEETSGRRTMDGFEISQIRQGGAADQVGLRNGDVVLEVNGQPLDSVASAMALFTRAPSMTQAKVTILRDGQRRELVVNVK